MSNIQYLDSVMGSGKTTKIIQWMIGNPHQRYLYVSPLLTEVEERIPTACGDLIGFSYPNPANGQTKSDAFLNLLKSGENISTTHSLFQIITEKHLKLIKDKGYILIVDEEIGMIEDFKAKKGFVNSLRGWGALDVNYQNHGQVVVLKEPEDDCEHFKPLFNYAKTGCLYVSKDNDNALVYRLPVSLLTAAQRVIILTYLFEASVLSKFLDMNNLFYSPFTAFEMPTEQEMKAKFRDLITIELTSSQKANRRRQREQKLGYLSTTWYQTSARSEELEELRQDLRPIYRKYPKDLIMITCPLSAVETRHVRSIHGRDVNPKVKLTKPDDDTMSLGWLGCGVRATNDFGEKSVMVHAYNRFPARNLSSYMTSWGHPIDLDNFALSEMLQWLWRGCVRNGKPMTVYILSDRMLSLFEGWLDNVEVEVLEDIAA